MTHAPTPAGRRSAQSMYGALERVLVKHPRDAFVSQAHLDEHWRAYGFTARPDYGSAVAEYDRFLELLARHVGDIAFAPRDARAGIDSLYIHDPVVITDGGAVLCSMGKHLRQGEPAAVEASLESVGVPIRGRISGSGRLEAGDVLWLDEHTLAVGCGPRTNEEGIRQLAALAAPYVDDVIPVALPEGAFHLLGLVSIVDRDLAVVAAALPVRVRAELARRGVLLVEVPAEEQRALACNVLAVAPRQCVMVAGSPRTEAHLAEHGASVWRYAGTEISLKGTGGPTCLTRPLVRRIDDAPVPLATDASAGAGTGGAPGMRR